MNKKEKHKSKNKKNFINNHYNNKTKQNRIQSIIFLNILCVETVKLLNLYLKFFILFNTKRKKH